MKKKLLFFAGVKMGVLGRESQSQQCKQLPSTQLLIEMDKQYILTSLRDMQQTFLICSSDPSTLNNGFYANKFKRCLICNSHGRYSTSLNEFKMTFNYLIFPTHNTFSIIINKYSHYKHLITYIYTQH